MRSNSILAFALSAVTLSYAQNQSDLTATSTTQADMGLVMVSTGMIPMATQSIASNNTSIINLQNITSNVQQQSSSSSSGNGQDNSADLVVLNLAFTLEQLESQFYKAALSAFSQEEFRKVGMSQQQSEIIIETIQDIQVDESTHVSALGGIISNLGATPFSGCKFNFGSALSDPLTFMSVARTLEQVGVGAYLGAAHIITDETLLTAAGSILTLESRHQSLLNTFNGGSFAGQSFDIPLAPEQVLALAGGFLEGCQASDLGLTANIPLSIMESSSRSTHFEIGSKLEFSSSSTIDINSLSCQMIVGGAPIAQVFPGNNCVVPNGINGPVAIYLTKSNTPLNTNILQMDKTSIVVGPALIFVDSKSSSFSEMFSIDSNHHERGSRSSADFGGMYMHRMSGNKEEIFKVVIERTVIEEKTVIKEVIINNGNNNNRHDNNRNNRNNEGHRNNNNNYNDNSRHNGNNNDGSRSYRRAEGGARLDRE